MNIGIRLHDTRPCTLFERLSSAKEQGLSCAHIAMSKVTDDFDMMDAPRLLTPERAAAVRNDLEKSGLSCAVLGCYLCIATPDDSERKAVHDVYRAHLRFAREIGAGCVGTETFAHPGSAFAAGAPDSEEAFAFFLDCLRPLVRAAEEEGSILAVEPVVWHIVSTPEKAERMLDALPSDNLRIILDSVNLLSGANAPRAGAIIDEAIARLGDKVSVLHMKDYRAVPGEERVRSMACGQGVMDYRGLLSFAKKYSLPMTLEDTVPDNAESARLHLERAAAHL